MIFFEMGIGQAALVAEMLEKKDFGSVKIFRDDAGIERVISAHRKKYG